MLSTRARMLTAAVAAALTVGLSAIPSGGQTAPAGTPVVAVSGHATGVFVDLAFDEEVQPTDLLAPTLDEGVLADEVGATALEHFTAGPAPTVTLPPEGGGPFTDSLPSLDLDLPSGSAPVSGPLSVSTEGSLGAAGRAASTARIEDFNPGGEEGLLGVTADLVEVQCSADLVGGPVGSTHIVNGVFDGPIPTDPAPNTVVFDETFENPGPPGFLIRGTIRIIANEQTVGANDITVRGLHVTAEIALVEIGGPVQVFETVEEIVGETACGVVPGAEIAPTFTG